MNEFAETTTTPTKAEKDLAPIPNDEETGSDRTRYPTQQTVSRADDAGDKVDQGYDQMQDGEKQGDEDREEATHRVAEVLVRFPQMRHDKDIFSRLKCAALSPRDA